MDVTAPQGIFLPTRKKTCLTSRLTPPVSELGPERVVSGRGGRDPGWGGGERWGMGATDSITALQQAGVFSSTHLFAEIIHLKRDGGGGGEGNLWVSIITYNN